MSINDVNKYSDDKQETRLNDQIDFDDYMDECITGGLPYLLHKEICGTHSNPANAQEECKIWGDYKSQIKPMLVWMKREKDK